MGISQGSALSPPLLNLYLTPLDIHMERAGVHYFRYADDMHLENGWLRVVGHGLYLTRTGEALRLGCTLSGGQP